MASGQGLVFLASVLQAFFFVGFVLGCYLLVKYKTWWPLLVVAGLFVYILIFGLKSPVRSLSQQQQNQKNVPIATASIFELSWNEKTVNAYEGMSLEGANLNLRIKCDYDLKIELFGPNSIDPNWIVEFENPDLVPPKRAVESIQASVFQGLHYNSYTFNARCLSLNIAKITLKNRHTQSTYMLDVRRNSQ
jgi:hypothetical protein